MSFLRVLTAAVLGGWMLHAAHGATFTGNATGTFGPPNPPENNSGAGTNEVRFGETATPNILRLDGQSFSAVDEASFPVATLTYTNGFNSFENVSIPATVTLAFTSPSGLTRNFDFTFDLTATDNLTGDPVLDADTLALPSAFSTTTFTVDGQEQTLKLLGFSTNAGQTIVGSFTLPEGQTVQSQLIGQITAPPLAAIPEPATAGLWLLGLGLLAARRTRRA